MKIITFGIDKKHPPTTTIEELIISITVIGFELNKFTFVCS